MRNYYDEILERIHGLIEERQYDEAQALLLTELNMPYVPLEFEKKLKELLVSIKESSNTGRVSEMDESELETYLYGNEEQQLIAVNQLSKQNLRMHKELCRAYLLSNPSTSAAALLIDSCIEQAINEDFVYLKGDVEYTFNPIDLQRPFKSGGFQVALGYLMDWFEHLEPSLYELCSQQLVFETFSFLPLSYDEEEGFDLALHVAKIVYGLMDRGHEWNQFLQRIQENEPPASTHLVS